VERPRLTKPKLIIKPELPEHVLTVADRVNVAAILLRAVPPTRMRVYGASDGSQKTRPVALRGPHLPR
jgi:hypothetical protein